MTMGDTPKETLLNMHKHPNGKETYNMQSGRQVEYICELLYKLSSLSSAVRRLKYAALLFGLGQTDSVLTKVVDRVVLAQESITEDSKWA
jgi:hypothetical protein